MALHRPRKPSTKKKPQKTRKYPTKKKTTTPEGKKEYQRLLMRAVYKRQKEKKEIAKQELLQIFPEREIKVSLPTVHDLLWGKSIRKPRKRKKRSKK